MLKVKPFAPFPQIRPQIGRMAGTQVGRHFRILCKAVGANIARPMVCYGQNPHQGTIDTDRILHERCPVWTAQLASVTRIESLEEPVTTGAQVHRPQSSVQISDLQLF